MTARELRPQIFLCRCQPMPQCNSADDLAAERKGFVLLYLPAVLGQRSNLAGGTAQHLYLCPLTWVQVVEAITGQ